MEHQRIHSKNGDTHYWIERNKDVFARCIVFTHGLTADHTMFERQVERFSPGYTVITWDVPLHGLSRPYRNFSYEQAAAELHSILTEESISKVILVGMLMGGYPCQMFASMFSDMTEGFIALDTTPFGTEYYSQSDLWWLKRVAPMAKCFPDKLLRQSMAKSVSETQYSYRKMLEMLKPLTKAQIIEQMDAAYGKFAEENRNLSLSVPILILCGDRDQTGKVKKYCMEWSAETGYPLHFIKKAAHFSNGDNPEQVYVEIEAFVRGL